MKHRTFFYWPTRIVLVVGIVATAEVVLLAGAVLDLGPLAQPCFGCEQPHVLGQPADVIQAAVEVGLAVVGLVWMIRISRGLREGGPPLWRYPGPLNPGSAARRLDPVSPGQLAAGRPRAVCL